MCIVFVATVVQKQAVSAVCGHQSPVIFQTAKKKPASDCTHIRRGAGPCLSAVLVAASCPTQGFHQGSTQVRIMDERMRTDQRQESPLLSVSHFYHICNNSQLKSQTRLGPDQPRLTINPIYPTLGPGFPAPFAFVIGKIFGMIKLFEQRETILKCFKCSEH